MARKRKDLDAEKSAAEKIRRCFERPDPQARTRVRAETIITTRGRALFPEALGG